MKPPIYIVTRDRVSDLRNLVNWLEKAGQENIVFLDNASTYGPLREYLHSSPHQVVWFPDNHGSQVLWRADMVPNEPFIVTDPDLVPIHDCPLDLVDRLGELLKRYTTKIGAGLYLDDVPGDLHCLPWEQSLVSPERETEPGVFSSLVDTTFALYPSGCYFNLQGIRTGWPYQMRHMSWYRRPEDLDDEHNFYLDRAIHGEGGTTTWRT